MKQADPSMYMFYFYKKLEERSYFLELSKFEAAKRFYELYSFFLNSVENFVKRTDESIMDYINYIVDMETLENLK